MDSPKIPTLKDSQKPQVKVRGLEAGVTLFDRLKQFKKKDLAFILAGLGTLFMAPLAEHFMMAPEQGDASLSAGFGGGKGGGGNGGIFGNTGPGSFDRQDGLAPGGAIGGGSDVITPLNVRDPSALVMGPGATQQPPTNSVMPATPPPSAPVTHSDSDLKDALAASARGVGGAAKAAKALLPVPKIALSGAGGLRGLGVASGSSSASAGNPAISSNGLVGNKAAQSDSTGNARATKGYAGVARGPGKGGSGLEALKNAAASQGESMNRGSAAAALDTAANQQLPNASGGFGGQGQGGPGTGDKAGGGNQDKSGKSVGESLDFLKKKAMQEKQIELWAKEQEAGDNYLEGLKIRNSMAEAIAGKIGGAIGDLVSCPITPGKNFKKCMGSAGAPPFYCVTDGGTASGAIDAAQVVGGNSSSCSSGGSDKASTTYYSQQDLTKGLMLLPCSGSGAVYHGCTTDGDIPKGGSKTDTDNGKVGQGTNPYAPNSPAAGIVAPPATLDALCTRLTDFEHQMANGMGASALGNKKQADDKALSTRIHTMVENAGKLVAIRDSVANQKTGECNSGSITDGISNVRQPIATLQGQAIGNLTTAVVPKLFAAVPDSDESKNLAPTRETISTNLKSIADAKQKLDDVSKAVEKDKFTDKSFTLDGLGITQAEINNAYGKDNADKNPVNAGSKALTETYQKTMAALKAAQEAQKILGAGQAEGQQANATAGADDKTVTGILKGIVGDGKAKDQGQTADKQNGDKQNSGTLSGVIGNNKALQDMVSALTDGKTYTGNVPKAGLKIEAPDQSVVQNDSKSKAGASVKAIQTAQQTLQKLTGGADAKDAKAPKTDGDLVTFDKAKPDDPATKTLQETIQSKELPAVTKDYTAMWKAEGSDINALKTRLGDARDASLGK